MDSNSPQVQFTDKALEAKFSYSWNRRELIILFDFLRNFQLPVGDIRSKILRTIYEEIERTAISSIGPNDYKQPENHIPKRSEVEVK